MPTSCLNMAPSQPPPPPSPEYLQEKQQQRQHSTSLPKKTLHCIFPMLSTMAQVSCFQVGLERVNWGRIGLPIH